MTARTPGKAAAPRIEPHDGLVEELIGVAGRLVATLERETALLAQMKTADVKPLQKEKAALARAYEERVRALKSKPELVRAAGKAIAEEFRACATKLAQASEANAVALRAAKAANERLLQCIVEAASEHDAAHHGYTSRGVATRDGYTAPERVSLTLNEQL